ncbi:cytochrome P450 [Aquincola sp. MAHUQ-54]|uniref:Cytochrome P450 n=1 Tax=Aquincola agrisoli TaxID=3119538 RepID=A0AAW9QGV3_9BURK
MSAVLRRPSWEPPVADPAFLDDPYPTYHAMRAAGPVLWSEQFYGGAWLLTRHADVERVLRDPRFAAQRTAGWAAGGDLRAFQPLFSRAMLFLDGADHQRVRRVLQAGFRPEALQRLQPHIEQWVREALDGVRPADGFDFMHTLARPLPVSVITRLMGVEAAQAACFVQWSDDLAAFMGALQPTHEQARRATASLLALARYFEGVIAQRGASPGDDLVGRLLQAQARGELEAGAELLSQCAMLLFAGHETTRHVLGNGLHALMQHPEQWERLRREPELMGPAVREMLRYDSPVQYTGRRLTVDLEMHGLPLRRGDIVVPLIGAANRDPARFARPDDFEVARQDGHGLSFGAGPHVCIGAALTMMEAQAVFRQLTARTPRLAWVAEASRRTGNPLYRGFAALHVRQRAAVSPAAWPAA